MEEKPVRDSVTEKTDRELSEGVFTKLAEMEKLFLLLRNSLASIDYKLAGVKDYSELVESTEKHFSEKADSISDELTGMQRTYSGELSAMHDDLKKSLANVETEIGGVAGNITSAEMNRMMSTVAAGMTGLNSAVTGRLEGVSSEFEAIVEKFAENLKGTVVTRASISSKIKQKPLKIKLFSGFLSGGEEGIVRQH